MVDIKAALKRLVIDQQGGTAVEYGLIVAVIAVPLISALVAFRGQITRMFRRSGKAVDSVDP